jgi:hypothetical protein
MTSIMETMRTTARKMTGTAKTDPFERQRILLRQLQKSLMERPRLDAVDDQALTELLELTAPSDRTEKLGASRDLHSLIREIRAEAAASINVEYQRDKAPDFDPNGPPPKRSIPAISNPEVRAYVGELIERALADVDENEQETKRKAEARRVQESRQAEIIGEAIAVDPHLAALLELYAEAKSEVSAAVRDLGHALDDPKAEAEARARLMVAEQETPDLRKALLARISRVWNEHPEFRELPKLTGHVMAAFARYRGLPASIVQTQTGDDVRFDAVYKARLKVTG